MNFKLYYKEPGETSHCRYNLVLNSTAYNFCYSASAKIHGVGFSSPVILTGNMQEQLERHIRETHAHTLQQVFNIQVHTRELKTQKIKLKTRVSVVYHDHEQVLESKKELRDANSRNICSLLSIFKSLVVIRGS